MGPWGIALAILIGASFTEGGRNGMRKAAKEGFKAGYLLREKGQVFFSEIKEKASDVVAEVKAEQAEILHAAQERAKSDSAV